MYKNYCSFGLNTQQLEKIPKERLAAFLRQYSNVLDEPDEIIDGFLNSLTDDEVIEHFESFESSLYGFGPFASVCEILQEEMEISLCYDKDEKIIFMPAMLPWNMKENDLKIRSKNDLQMLFQPFLNELGIPDEILSDIYVKVALIK